MATPNDADSMFISLSELDFNGVDGLSTTFGYTVTNVDTVKLEAAANRLADRWRLLAGRVEPDTSSSAIVRWGIRVPLGKLDQTTSRVNFTVAYSNKHLPPGRPEPGVFLHPDATVTLDTIAAANRPLLTIHVTIFPEKACVGITIPHGVFDAVGMGLVVNGLNAELNGIKEWTPPPLLSRNHLSAALQNPNGAPILSTTESLYQYCNGNRSYLLLKFLYGYVSEFIWHQLEVKSIYLGPRIVQHVVGQTKKEIAQITGGKSWVSTGDIMMAWILKAAYTRKPSKRDTLAITPYISVRGSFKDEIPEADIYPHNAIIGCEFSPVSAASFSRLSLAEVSLLHRKAIEKGQNPSAVRTFANWLANIGGIAIPVRKPGLHQWVLTNQCIGGFTDIDFGPGSDLIEFTEYHAKTIFLDHWVSLNKFKGGFVFIGGLRRARWRSIERELAALKQEGWDVRYTPLQDRLVTSWSVATVGALGLIGFGLRRYLLENVL